ncbi:MAG: alpha/beta hydrolase [Daejeonella sp.]|nr:alpha/beta hydrolase [Daejeonella sp.]
MSNVFKRNNVTVTGSGEKVMLFAHGYGCDQNVWRSLTRAFENDYKIVLFDYVGAGKSDLSAYDPVRYSTLDGYATDILEICAELNISQAIFIGHSVSSMIGVLAANKEPSIFEKMVFIGPSPRYLNDEGYVGGFNLNDLEDLFNVMDNNYLGWAQALAPAIMGNADRPELGESLTNSFCATDPEIAKQFARVTFLSDNREDLPKLKVKSLTLQCSEDIIAPIEVGRYVQEHTPGNKLQILKATGHCSHLSAPEETINAIKSFVS